MPETVTTDVISGFPYADPNCKGRGKPLLLENAWSTDGCPCNSQLGVNSINETRWRLLMELCQKKMWELEQKLDEEFQKGYEQAMHEYKNV